MSIVSSSPPPTALVPGHTLISPDPRAGLIPAPHVHVIQTRTVDAGVKLAAVLVLLEEGLERVKEGHFFGPRGSTVSGRHMNSTTYLEPSR